MTRRAQRPAMTGRNRRQESRVIPCLEALEDRTLLSAAISLAPGAYDPTQVLVQFRPAALASGAPALNVPGAALGPQLSSVPGLYDVQLNGLSVPAALAIFQADPRVQSVEPDYYLQVTGTPNDPQFGNQWGLQNTGQSGGTAGVDVHATQAWTVTTGSPGVTVAQIDTGVDYDNVDLYQNIWINQAEVPNFWYTKSSASSTTYNEIVYKSQIKTATPGVITFADLNNPVNKGLVWDNNGDGRIDPADLLRPLAQGGWDSGSTKDGDTAHPDDFFGWNFVANDNNPFDDNGHGTNVAGVLAASGNNGYGVAGIDWNVPLMELKAFDSSGFSSISEIVEAIDYSIQHGAKISNNSWSVGSESDDLLSAVTAARDAGQIFVAAAGNDGNPTPNYPARYAAQLDNVVSVAAIDRTGKLWSSSDYGATTVTLAAPGVDVVGDGVGGGSTTYTGTSQAVPFVSGTLALVWGLNPTWTYKQVIADVTSTTTPLASLQGKTITGGLLNAGAALGAASNGGGHGAPPPAPNVLSDVFGGPNANSLSDVLVTFDQIMDLTTFTSSQVHLTNPAGQSVPITARIAPGSDGHEIEIDFGVQTALGNLHLEPGRRRARLRRGGARRPQFRLRTGPGADRRDLDEGDAHSGPRNGHFNDRREPERHDRRRPGDAEHLAHLRQRSLHFPGVAERHGGAAGQPARRLGTQFRQHGPVRRGLPVDPPGRGAVHRDVPAGIAPVHLRRAERPRYVDAVGGRRKRRRRGRDQQLVADHHGGVERVGRGQRRFGKGLDGPAGSCRPGDAGRANLLHAHAAGGSGGRRVHFRWGADGGGIRSGCLALPGRRGCAGGRRRLGRRPAVRALGWVGDTKKQPPAGLATGGGHL